MEMKFQHPAIKYVNPETGIYDDNELINRNGELWVTGTYIVCPTCKGNGTHFRRDLDENHLVDMMREDGDEEGIEAYYAGAFDAECEKCHGKRVVMEPVLPEWAEKMLRDWYHAEAISAAERAAERRAGC